MGALNAWNLDAGACAVQAGLFCSLSLLDSAPGFTLECNTLYAGQSIQLCCKGYLMCC